MNIVLQPSPKFEQTEKRLHMKTRILIVITFMVIAIAFILNFLFPSVLNKYNYEGLFAIPVTLLVIVVWIIVKGMIYDYQHFQKNFVIGLVFLGILGCSIEYLLYFGWGFEHFYMLMYGIPALFVTGSVTLSLRCLLRKKYYQDDMIYIFILCILNLAYTAVFVAVKLFGNLQTSTMIFSAWVAGGVIVGMFLLAPKKTLLQLKKIFVV
jgi:hypothetical protein